MKSLVTAEDIKQLHRDGKASLTVVPSCTIITPEARDVAKKLGVKMLETDTSASNKSAVESNTRQAIRQAVEAKLPAGEHAPALLEQLIEKAMRELNTPVPYCDREVATNGVILVRGSSVKFGAFDGVPDKAIGLTDVITGADNSSIAAGFMQWEKCSFPWTLTYDEIDVVLEGELHITCNGKTHIGKPGDVFFIPKGSAIEFGTPDKVRFVYVAYPADWSTSK
ncbi:ethanolamine utilization acetate kinase EutQ [Dasania marina]|uniref:ethanolamine utilization acetate kinase EutQ n=1 Tax=Dasania marina TaxID=471499 RepID=UPI0030D7F375|tara:strand:+ start:17687 stop:18358 length:672 start_codon:yes stop_codon:yes gene_type:complete